VKRCSKHAAQSSRGGDLEHQKVSGERDNKTAGLFQVNASMHGESMRRSTDRCKQKIEMCSQEHRTVTELYNWDGGHQEACTVTEELKLGSAKLRLTCERQRCRQGQCRYPR
jgi:hypothetical protein